MGAFQSCPECPEPPDNSNQNQYCTLQNADWFGNPKDICYQYNQNGSISAYGDMIGSVCIPTKADCCEVAPDIFQEKCASRHTLSPPS